MKFRRVCLDGRTKRNEGVNGSMRFWNRWCKRTREKPNQNLIRRYIRMNYRNESQTCMFGRTKRNERITVERGDRFRIAAANE